MFAMDKKLVTNIEQLSTYLIKTGARFNANRINNLES